MDATEPGRFDFALNPYMNRCSARMGVHERYYTANLRQVGQFIPSQNLAVALETGSIKSYRIPYCGTPVRIRTVFTSIFNQIVSPIVTTIQA